MKRYLAIDIGASSGRHVVGWWENGDIQTEEVYRFPNGMTETAPEAAWSWPPGCFFMLRGMKNVVLSAG